MEAAGEGEGEDESKLVLCALRVVSTARSLTDLQSAPAELGPSSP